MVLAMLATVMAQANAAPNELDAAASLAASAPEITLRTQDFRAPPPQPVPKWIAVPRLSGRLMAADIGLVINTADPYSVAVGAYYAQARKLKEAQVLRVDLPVKAALTPAEFKVLESAIERFFGASTQALALAWVEPYAVNCNSITGALALGYDAELCAKTCEPSRRSPYFETATSRPFTDLHLRPSMLLAAKDVASAQAMIRRGVASDRTLGLRGAPPANAYFVSTPDQRRSVRSVLFPPAGIVARAGLDVRIEATAALENVDRVVLYQTGAVRVEKLDTIHWLPGALADHLTSVGGQLMGGAQMSAIEWITSGATASYGTVSEPCNHLQKFPHPQVLLLNYAQGSTAIEAYWKSVAWPQQGVFIGEPLAAPFARR